jgi:hypothetical protein
LIVTCRLMVCFQHITQTKCLSRLKHDILQLNRFLLQNWKNSSTCPEHHPYSRTNVEQWIPESPQGSHSDQHRWNSTGRSDSDTRHRLKRSIIGKFRGDQCQRLNSHLHSIGDVVFVASSSIDRLIDRVQLQLSHKSFVTLDRSRTKVRRDVMIFLRQYTLLYLSPNRQSASQRWGSGT